MENANYLAIILAALCAFLVGWLWYGPLFGKAWRAELGFADEKAASGNLVKIYGLTFLFALLSSVMLDHMFLRTGVTKPHVIMMMSVGIALTFIIPAIGITYLFGQKSGRLFAIDAGYWISFYAAMGAVYVVIGP